MILVDVSGLYLAHAREWQPDAVEEEDRDVSREEDVGGVPPCAMQSYVITGSVSRQ